MDGHTEDILNRRWQLRGDFNKQVTQILRTVKMRQEIEDLQLLYDDIQRTFNKIWPGFVVKPFGSVVTGLALKGSDVDCLGELPENCNDDPKSCVEKCQDLIANRPSPFEQATVRIKKVPVVKFIHRETGRQCDLSFNKPMVKDFSKLVAYLLNLDARGFKLTILIKYWAKIQKVTGVKRMPSNALLILVISFLQYKKILPPVVALQKNLPPNKIEGWNTAFTEIHYESHKGESLYNLLGDFFKYYSEFNFRDLVVCPYLGYPLKRCEFWNVDKMLPEFWLYKENLNAGLCEMIFLNCIMSIQDPFEHARNCAGPIRPQVAGEIINHFQGAAVVYETSTRKEFLNKLLSYMYREPEIPQYSVSWQFPPRNKYNGRTRIHRRPTPRSLAYRARGNTANRKRM